MMQFLITGSRMAVFHGTPALAARGGQPGWFAEGWGCMHRKTSNGKAMVKETGFLLCSAAGLVYGAGEIAFHAQRGT